MNKTKKRALRRRLIKDFEEQAAFALQKLLASPIEIRRIKKKPLRLRSKLLNKVMQAWLDKYEAELRRRENQQQELFF